MLVPRRSRRPPRVRVVIPEGTGLEAISPGDQVAEKARQCRQPASDRGGGERDLTVLQTYAVRASIGSVPTKVKNTNRSNPDASTVFGRHRAATNRKRPSDNS